MTSYDVGHTQGKLTVVAVAGTDRRGILWACSCTCGRTCVKQNRALAQGDMSCSISCSKRTHGATGTKEYRAWRSIKERCLNPANKSYANYGGRGITMHPAWIEDFPAFYAEIGPAPTPAHSVDRVDNGRGYEPSNVRWATQKQQQNNTRANVMVEINAVVMTRAEAAEVYGIGSTTVDARLKRGLCGGALVAPVTRFIHIEHDGVEMLLADLAKLGGLKYRTVNARYHRGVRSAHELTAPVGRR